MDWHEAVALNRAHWDAMAAVHAEGYDTYYDVDALAAGADTLLEAETDAVGDVTGLDALHVQCHVGFDAVSLARRGARVTGVDFSPAALAKARAIAARCGVDVEYVEADVLDLPAALHGRFDLAYATIGVLVWIADVDAWMRSVAALLRPQGRLVLVELHPFYDMVASLDPLKLDFPYAGAGAGGRRFDEDGSYAAPDARLQATESVQYAHSIGEVVTAALDAGLRLDVLKEHLEVLHDPRGLLEADPDGRYRLRIHGELLPVLYTLVATSSP